MNNRDHYKINLKKIKFYVVVVVIYALNPPFLIPTYSCVVKLHFGDRRKTVGRNP